MSDAPRPASPTPHEGTKSAPIEFVLQPAAYDWLLAEKERLPTALQEAVRLAIPDDGGHRLTMSRHLALELAYLLVTEGRRRNGLLALDDMWLEAVTTIGLELRKWPPRRGSA